MLERWTRFHEQTTFEGITDWAKEIGFLNQFEYAEEQIHFALNGHCGFLPYPPRRYTPDTPGYVAELDD